MFNAIHSHLPRLLHLLSERVQTRTEGLYERSPRTMMLKPNCLLLLLLVCALLVADSDLTEVPCGQYTSITPSSGTNTAYELEGCADPSHATVITMSADTTSVIRNATVITSNSRNVWVQISSVTLVNCRVTLNNVTNTEADALKSKRCTGASSKGLMFCAGIQLVTIFNASVMATILHLRHVNISMDGALLMISPIPVTSLTPRILLTDTTILVDECVGSRAPVNLTSLTNKLVLSSIDMHNSTLSIVGSYFSSGSASAVVMQNCDVTSSYVRLTNTTVVCGGNGAQVSTLVIYQSNLRERSRVLLDNSRLRSSSVTDTSGGMNYAFIVWSTTVSGSDVTLRNTTVVMRSVNAAGVCGTIYSMSSLWQNGSVFYVTGGTITVHSSPLQYAMVADSSTFIGSNVTVTDVAFDGFQVESLFVYNVVLQRSAVSIEGVSGSSGITVQRTSIFNQSYLSMSRFQGEGNVSLIHVTVSTRSSVDFSEIIIAGMMTVKSCSLLHLSELVMDNVSIVGGLELNAILLTASNVTVKGLSTERTFTLVNVSAGDRSVLVSEGSDLGELLLANVTLSNNSMISAAGSRIGGVRIQDTAASSKSALRFDRTLLTHGCLIAMNLSLVSASRLEISRIVAKSSSDANDFVSIVSSMISNASIVIQSIDCSNTSGTSVMCVSFRRLTTITRDSMVAITDIQSGSQLYGAVGLWGVVISSGCVISVTNVKHYCDTAAFHLREANVLDNSQVMVNNTATTGCTGGTPGAASAVEGFSIMDSKCADVSAIGFHGINVSTRRSTSFVVDNLSVSNRSTLVVLGESSRAQCGSSSAASCVFLQLISADGNSYVMVISSGSRVIGDIRSQAATLSIANLSAVNSAVEIVTRSSTIVSAVVAMHLQSFRMNDSVISCVGNSSVAGQILVESLSMYSGSLMKLVHSDSHVRVAGTLAVRIRCTIAMDGSGLLVVAQGSSIDAQLLVTNLTATNDSFVSLLSNASSIASFDGYPAIVLSSVATNASTLMVCSYSTLYGAGARISDGVTSDSNWSIGFGSLLHSCGSFTVLLLRIIGETNDTVTVMSHVRTVGASGPAVIHNCLLQDTSIQIGLSASSAADVGHMIQILNSQLTDCHVSIGTDVNVSRITGSVLVVSMTSFVGCKITVCGGSRVHVAADGVLWMPSSCMLTNTTLSIGAYHSSTVAATSCQQDCVTINAVAIRSTVAMDGMWESAQGRCVVLLGSMNSGTSITFSNLNCSTLLGSAAIVSADFINTTVTLINCTLSSSTNQMGLAFEGPSTCVDCVIEVIGSLLRIPIVFLGMSLSNGSIRIFQSTVQTSSNGVIFSNVLLNASVLVVDSCLVQLTAGLPSPISRQVLFIDNQSTLSESEVVLKSVTIEGGTLPGEADTACYVVAVSALMSDSALRLKSVTIVPLTSLYTPIDVAVLLSDQAAITGTSVITIEDSIMKVSHAALFLLPQLSGSSHSSITVARCSIVATAGRVSLARLGVSEAKGAYGVMQITVTNTTFRSFVSSNAALVECNWLWLMNCSMPNTTVIVSVWNASVAGMLLIDGSVFGAINVTVTDCTMRGVGETPSATRPLVRMTNTVVMGSAAIMLRRAQCLAADSMPIAATAAFRAPAIAFTVGSGSSLLLLTVDDCEFVGFGQLVGPSDAATGGGLQSLRLELYCTWWRDASWSRLRVVGRRELRSLEGCGGTVAAHAVQQCPLLGTELSRSTSVTHDAATQSIAAGDGTASQSESPSTKSPTAGDGTASRSYTVDHSISHSAPATATLHTSISSRLRATSSLHSLTATTPREAIATTADRGLSTTSMGVATTATLVSTLVGGAAASPGDAVGLAVLALLPCATGRTWDSAAGSWLQRAAISVFYDVGPLASVLGNLGLAAGLFLLHSAAAEVRTRHCARKERRPAAAVLAKSRAALRYPSLSHTITTFLLPGALFALGATARADGGLWSVVGAGLCAAASIGALTAIVYWHVSRAVVPWATLEPVAVRLRCWPACARGALPDMVWSPKHVAQSSGSLFASVRSLRLLPLHYVLAYQATVFSLVGGVPVSGTGGCAAQLFVLAALAAVPCLVVVYHELKLLQRPAANHLVVVSSLGTSGICVVNALVLLTPEPWRNGLATSLTVLQSVVAGSSICKAIYNVVVVAVLRRTNGANGSAVFDVLIDGDGTPSLNPGKVLNSPASTNSTLNSASHSSRLRNALPLMAPLPPAVRHSTLSNKASDSFGTYLFSHSPPSHFERVRRLESLIRSAAAGASSGKC